jgi:hypothetical protein
VAQRPDGRVMETCSMPTAFAPASFERAAFGTEIASSRLTDAFTSGRL